MIIAKRDDGGFQVYVGASSAAVVPGHRWNGASSKFVAYSRDLLGRIDWIYETDSAHLALNLAIDRAEVRS